MAELVAEPDVTFHYKLQICSSCKKILHGEKGWKRATHAIRKTFIRICNEYGGEVIYLQCNICKNLERSVKSEDIF